MSLKCNHHLADLPIVRGQPPSTQTVTQHLIKWQTYSTHLQQLVPGDFVISVQVIQTESNWENKKNMWSHKRHIDPMLWNPLNVHSTGHQLHPDKPVPLSSTLTEQFVCPAVEWLAGWGVLVLLIVLDGSEVSQGPHEAPEVYLVLSKTNKQTEKKLRQKKWHENLFELPGCGTDTKKTITDSFVLAQVTIILKLNNSWVGSTMRAQTSRKSTPFYQVQHPLSSSSGANKAKPEQQEQIWNH